MLILADLNFDIKSIEFEKSSDILVEVKGEVENPGVYNLPRGSKFEDLLGQLQLKDTADLSSLSMLKKMRNDELVVIPKQKAESKISINSADLKTLMELPSIGEKTALKIIEYRNVNGGFKELSELQNVSGIKRKTYEKIKDLITL